MMGGVAGRPHIPTAPRMAMPQRQRSSLVGGPAESDKHSLAALLKKVSDADGHRSPEALRKAQVDAIAEERRKFTRSAAEAKLCYQDPNKSEICVAEKKQHLFGTREHVDATTFHRRLREFDSKRPIASKVAAVASVAALSTLIGTLCGAAVDMLAHMSDRKNDNAGRLFGTLVGCVVALTHGLMLFGAPRRFEMALRAGEFRGDTKTPGGQSRLFLEKASLPLLEAVEHNGSSNYGESHNNLRVNSTNICKGITRAVRMGFDREKFNAHFIVDDNAPQIHLPAHRLQCDINSLGLRKGQYVLSKYLSFNHLFERDFYGRWDHSARTLDKFLGKLRDENLQEIEKPPEPAAKGPKVALTARVEPNREETQWQCAPNDDLVAARELESVPSSENINYNTENQVDGQSIDERVESKPTAEKTGGNVLKPNSGGANAELPRHLTDEEKIGLIRAKFVHVLGDTALANKLDDATCLKLHDFYIQGKNRGNGDNYSVLELMDHDTYCKLSTLFRELVPQNPDLLKSWARIDEAGKIAALYTGLRPAGMHTFFRNLEDSVVRAFTGFADPNMQGQNAGMSAPMYLPMMVLGSTVTVLLLGMSASPSAPVTIDRTAFDKNAAGPKSEGVDGAPPASAKMDNHFKVSSAAGSNAMNSNPSYPAYPPIAGSSGFAIAT